MDFGEGFVGFCGWYLFFCGGFVDVLWKFCLYLLLVMIIKMKWGFDWRKFLGNFFFLGVFFVG